MSKRKKIFFRIMVSLLLGCLLVLIFSILLRFKYRDTGSIEDWDWVKEDEVLYRMLKDKYPSENDPNFPVIMMKNQDIPEKEEDEKRILVIGDSFTYGYSGTNINYTWWKQLDWLIKEEGYENINVYATGRYNVNTKDELEQVIKNKKLMEKIDPDLIIIGYVYNDPEERDENGKNIIRGDWEPNFPGNIILKLFPNFYKEIQHYYNYTDFSVEQLKRIGSILGAYRYDIRGLMIAQGENLENYKNVLSEMDKEIRKLDIPYFYYFTNNIENELINQANINVYNAMQELGINAYYTPYKWNSIKEKYNIGDDYSQYINPVDFHPGIIWTYDCGKTVFELLKEDYNSIFEKNIIKEIQNSSININDTMPFLEVKKISNNIFEFEYPSLEEKKTKDSQFLYYPLEKNHIKLNFSYPKKVSKILVIGDNIKDSEIYVNTIDDEYGFDINEAKGILNSCKKVNENVFEVDKKITSVNIVVNFKDDSDRTIKVEFIQD